MKDDQKPFKLRWPKTIQNGRRPKKFKVEDEQKKFQWKMNKNHLNWRWPKKIQNGRRPKNQNGGRP